MFLIFTILTFVKADIFLLIASLLYFVQLGIAIVTIGYLGYTKIRKTETLVIEEIEGK